MKKQKSLNPYKNVISSGRSHNSGVKSWAENRFKQEIDYSDPVELAGVLKGARTYVRMLTQRDIQVKFESDQSYTDGKTITLSAEIKPENLDSTFGLALHEASHICQSDFPLFRDVAQGRNLPTKFQGHQHILKNILNWVEDRRIDQWAWSEAPGYRQYYESLYYRYFWSEEQQATLWEREMNPAKDPKDPEEWLYWMFQIINPQFKGDYLPKMDEFVKLIDVQNISRLKNTKDAWGLSQKIWEFILNQSDPQKVKELEEKFKEMDQSGQFGEDDPEDGDSQPGEGEGDSDEEAEAREASKGNGNRSAAIRKFAKMGSDPGNSDPEGDEKDEKNKAQAKKENSDRSPKGKVKVSPDLTDLIEDMMKCDIRQDDIENEKVQTITKIPISAIKGGLFDCFRTSVLYQKEVTEGIALGKQLAKKLKTRNEDRTTDTFRLDSGKISKRHLASAGYGETAIFKQTNIATSEPIGIHISLDASGSMQGSKWKKTLKSSVSILTACSYFPEIRVQLSVRYDNSVNFGLVVYDSQFDKGFEKIRALAHMTPTGGTPEGINFMGLMKESMKPLMNNRSIFINYSDGQPNRCNSGKSGIQITKEAVNTLRGMGMEVISFFIYEGSKNSSDEKAFTDMYGKDARMVDVDALMPLAKELNRTIQAKGLIGH